MTKALIISGESAFKAARIKYNFITNTSPKEWPILVLIEDTKEPQIAHVVTPTMAITLLSKMSQANIEKLDSGVYKAAKTALSIKTNQGGLTIWKSGTKYEIGQVVHHKGMNYVVTSGNSWALTGSASNELMPSYVADDVEVGEDDVNEEKETIVGLEEIPLDPAKLEDDHNIADLEDMDVHVLDTERAV